MSNRVLWLAPLICFLALCVACGGTGGASAVASSGSGRSDWVSFVQTHAHAVQSVDPDDRNFSDWAFLAPLLTDRKIVELGESGHGVAEFSQAKIRLIKYLHEQLGYDVLAFESSILSTYLSNDQASQLTATAFMQNSVFGVWSTTDVVKLFSYLQATQGTSHPLILAGFDVQLTSAWEMQIRPAVFQEVVAQIDRVYAQEVHDFDQALMQDFSDTYIQKNYADLKAKYQALTAFLDANMTQIESCYTTRPLFPLMVRQAAWGMSAYLDARNEYASNNFLSSNNIRDAGMATNLEVLTENLYAGKKIIVWAHNVHIAHDAKAVSEWGWQNMGKWIFQKYGHAVYTVGLYMYQGSADWNDRTTYTIAPASNDSVEGLLHSTGDPFVFLDFSTATNTDPGTAWMFQGFSIRDWGVYGSSMVLKNEYDGLLQIDTVHPPTYMN